MRKKWIDLLEKKFKFKKYETNNICSTTICCIGYFDADYEIQLLNFVVDVFLYLKIILLISCRGPPSIGL